MAGLFGTIAAWNAGSTLPADRPPACLVHDDRQGFELARGDGWRSGAVGPAASTRRIALPDGAVVMLSGDIVPRGASWADLAAAFSTLPDIMAGAPEAIPAWFDGVDGCFAFALIDPAGRRLLLGNDRYGGVPLYTARSQGALHWASEVKGLAQVTGAAIDDSALTEFLRTGWLAPPRSYYTAIEQLPPRSALLVDLSTQAGTAIEVYRPRPAPVPVPADFAEAKTRFSVLTREAIAKRLAAAGTGDIVVTLSGGLDSRLLAAEARRHARVRAVTYGDPRSHEVRIAADIARRLDIEHEILPVDRGNWLAGRDRAIWMADGMMDVSHTHIIHTFPAMAGAGMVLDGLFGDVVLGRGAITVAPAESEAANRYLRVNRFTYFGPRMEQNVAPVSTPLIDHDLVEFMDALPETMTAGGRLYREASGEMHPEIYSAVPWLKTNASPYPYRRHRLGGTAVRIRRKVAQLSSWSGLPLFRADMTTDYYGWYHDPAFRALYRGLIDGRGAMLRSHVPVPDTGKLFSRLPSLHRFRQIGRLLTLEVWLRQAAAGRALLWDEMLDASQTSIPAQE